MAAILKGKSTVRSGDGTDVYLRALLSGELATADYFTIMALKGYLFTANSGLVTTPITWTATATIDITKPVMFVAVPTGKAIIPISIDLYMEAFGTSAQFECNAVSGTGGSLTSGGATITPVSSRVDLGLASASVVTGGGTAIVTVGSTANLNTIWRDGAQFTITKTAGSATASAGDQYKFSWSALQQGAIHIVGPNAQLAIHQGSQAGTGFCTLKYIELDSSALP